MVKRKPASSTEEKKMSGRLSYNFLGSSGLKVSNLCLGTMNFGETKDEYVQCNEEQSHAIMDRFVERGGNFIDTANCYKDGRTEEIVGTWLSKQQRERIVLATKVRATMNDDPNGKGLSRQHIMSQVENSLKRLRTDYIDLYQIHNWDYGIQIEEMLSTMNDLVKAGKVRYLGCSNVTGWQLQKIIDTCKYRGWEKWITIQNQYSLLSRHSELEIVDVCRIEGVGLMPWSPLKGGWLTGKIKRDGQMEQGSRLHYASSNKGKVNQAFPDFAQFDNEKTWSLLDLTESIAKKHGKSAAQVALRWLLQKDFVSSVVIGAKTVKQLDDNLDASSGWEMTKEEMKSLDEASAIDIPYPYELIWRLNKDRYRGPQSGQ